jgi:hypothetical protein
MLMLQAVRPLCELEHDHGGNISPQSTPIIHSTYFLHPNNANATPHRL